MTNFFNSPTKLAGASCIAAVAWVLSAPAAEAGSVAISVQAATSSLSVGCASVAAQADYTDTGDTLSITQNFFAGEVLTFSAAAPATNVNIQVDGSIVVTQTATPAAVSYTIATTGSQQIFFVWSSGAAATVSVSCTSSTASTAGNVVNATTAQAQGTQIIGAVFNHLNSLAGVGGGTNDNQASLLGDTPLFSLSGMSAGDGLVDSALWVSASYSGAANSASGVSFDGDMVNIQTGMDYHVNKDVVTGLSVGLGFADLKNVGGAAGVYKEKSYSIAPYAQIRFDDMYTLGATMGYAWGNVDQINAASGASGSSTSTMKFVAARGGADYDIDPSTQISGRLSGVYLSKGISGFTDSLNLVNASTGNSKVMSLSIGSEFRHTVEIDNGHVTPYLGADYQKDYQSTINNDDSALMLSYGFRGETTDGIFFTLDGSTQLMRDDFTSYTIGGRAGIKF